MNALGIIGCTLGGALTGFVAGFWYGESHDESDLPGLAAFFYGLTGAGIGGFAGVVVGSVVFT